MTRFVRSGSAFAKSTVFVTLLAAACGSAMAQSAAYNTASANRVSYLPYTSAGYVGVAVGQSKYKVGNGTGLYSSDDKDTAFKLYGGGMFNQNFGLELGYVNFGEIDRAGGNTKAHGLNLSLVGKAPVGDRFDVFGKLGTTYGWTRTSSAAGSGVRGGKEDGFGVSYGVGASYYFTPQVAATLEWERHDMKFAGTGRDGIQAVTVGLKYQY